MDIHLGRTSHLLEILEKSSLQNIVIVDEITWIVSISQIGDLINGFIELLLGNHIDKRMLL